MAVSEPPASRPFPQLDPKMRGHVVDYLSERMEEARVDKAFLDREYGRGFFAALGAALDHLRSCGPPDEPSGD